MIDISPSIDLGRDKTRMKDPRDAQRQKATVQEILRRFFEPTASKRYEIQVLADEVGMGKTYVALATAFSLLEEMRNGTPVRDLEDCYQRVLIITPQNQALFQKWTQEVGEFAKRCVINDQEKVRNRFRVTSTEKTLRLDDLSAELRMPGTQPEIIVTHTGIFHGGKLLDYALKRQFLLGCLFRYWGGRFRYNLRQNLLKGAPDGWPRNPDHLHALSDGERARLRFTEDELIGKLDWVARFGTLGLGKETLEDLLELCREIAQPYMHNRTDLFSKVEARLVALYRTIAGKLILRDFPLVIVDEAHNWKNGPTTGANGFEEFSRFIACHARRTLLLTATPFQLRPEELLEILKISDHMEPCSTKKESQDRREYLKEYREQVIRPVLADSAQASRLFSKEWARLSIRIRKEDLEEIWASLEFVKVRQELATHAKQHGRIEKSPLLHRIKVYLAGIDPDLRPFLHEALLLYAYNCGLSTKLGALVIRHRRRTEHRLFKIGVEIDTPQEKLRQRGDRHVLHAAAGLDVRGGGELPHYILMRCVTDMKRLQRKKGRSSLGSALTGCYSTLLDSVEGKSVQKWLQASPVSRAYLDLLMSMVSPKEDPDHPKVKRIVEEVLEYWRRGEKSLIFCFRVNTAERLREIIDSRIRAELAKRRTKCLGGEKQLKYLQSRLTGRERDLVVIGLDRTLLSLLSVSGTKSIKIDDLVLTNSDVQSLAKLSLKYGVNLTADRVDRVFLYRAVEHVITARLSSKISLPTEFRNAFEDMMDEAWVSHPYGLETSDDTDVEAEERSSFDERGVGTVYKESSEPSEDDVKKVAARLLEMRAHARKTGQVALLDSYSVAPSLWLGLKPTIFMAPDCPEDAQRRCIFQIHKHLWQLTKPAGEWEGWESRRRALRAMRTAVLRNSVLMRLLPERVELDEATWGDLLVQAFFKALPGQSESMANHVVIFLEDLDAASGTLATDNQTDGGLRLAMFEATRLRDQQFVALVKGGGGSKENERRNRVFTGFNTPLLPEVLVCTAVGQEGIDLHRHCRHVIHYDLAWNPAVLEQRTGRTDRIGSKTFRERELAEGIKKPFLEIPVPFLAGTYDERMYEELRIRAQMFEVLTGGDLSADNREGFVGEKDDEGHEGGYAFLALPEAMVKGLRVNLNIWSG
jgi:hypothetical protein